MAYQNFGLKHYILLMSVEFSFRLGSDNGFAPTSKIIVTEEFFSRLGSKGELR